LRILHSIQIFLAFLTSVFVGTQAMAFCGFYVGKADKGLFNEASQVVIVRNEDKNILTMVNDYKGDAKEFALVVPVPSVLAKDQIRVTDKKYVEHLDAFSSPRLVEYFDSDPCLTRESMLYDRAGSAPKAANFSGAALEKQKSLGVTIEAQYTVGEYDILILSAKESSGLTTWLKENKYKIPKGAEAVLDSYIKQNLKFFVAKVNLKEQAKTGFTFLRPLQMAFESPRFMLPIRLGTVNSNGPQDLIIMTITQKGRVETTNYRTVKIPSGMNIPPYVRNEFGPVYKAMFAEQVRKEDMKAVFLEYAWDMSWCDPCASEPLTTDELKELGVFWLADPQVSNEAVAKRGFAPPQMGATNAFVTRIHVRYTAEKFPDDLMFQETSNRENFQGRFVLQQPFKGEIKCEAAKSYVEGLKIRQDQEAKTLASLTGWDVNEIRTKMGVPKVPSGTEPSKDKWWEKAWKKAK
jgi:hypothetical protein